MTALLQATDVRSGYGDAIVVDGCSFAIGAGEAVALLGDYVSTVREVLGLRVGDIVRLSTTPDEPLVVRVGDKNVFLGSPVVHHGNIAVQIQSVDSAAA